MTLMLRYWPQLTALLAALACAWWLHHTGYQAGAAEVRALWELEHDQLEEQHDKEVARLNAAARYMDVRFIETVREVEGRTRTIVQEVPRYVPVEADRACPIPVGFVRVHDAAAAGDDGVPADPAPAGADAAPSGVALSTVAATVAENYGACNANAEQLRALQAYLVEVNGVSPDAP